MRGLLLHGRELRRGPPGWSGETEALSSAADPRSCGVWAFLGPCCAAQRLGAHDVSETGDCGLGVQAGTVSIGLGQGLFCFPSGGVTKTGSWGSINTLLISRGMYKADGGGERMAPLRMQGQEYDCLGSHPSSPNYRQ